jgi:hypothetical protein
MKEYSSEKNIPKLRETEAKVSSQLKTDEQCFE